MTRGEKIHKRCCIAMCFIPSAFILIRDILHLSSATQDIVWLIIFVTNIVLILAAFKISKDMKRRDKIMCIMTLTLLIGYMLYSVFIS